VLEQGLFSLRPQPRRAASSFCCWPLIPGSGGGYDTRSTCPDLLPTAGRPRCDPSRWFFIESALHRPAQSRPTAVSRSNAGAGGLISVAERAGESPLLSAQDFLEPAFQPAAALQGVLYPGPLATTRQERTWLEAHSALLAVAKTPALPSGQRPGAKPAPRSPEPPNSSRLCLGTPITTRRVRRRMDSSARALPGCAAGPEGEIRLASKAPLALRPFSSCLSSMGRGSPAHSRPIVDSIPINAIDAESELMLLLLSE